MKYQRVIPRDLFNEAKLLKCIGKISVLIHDNKIKGLEALHDGDAFKITQSLDGQLTIDNIHFFDEDGTTVSFSTNYNSKEDWPLEMIYMDKYYYPLNEKGEYQLSDKLFLNKRRTK